MRRVIGASRWRYMITVGVPTAGERGCSPSLSSSPTATTTVLVTQLAHRSQQQETPSPGQAKRERQEGRHQHHQRHDHHGEWRNAAPLSRQYGRVQRPNIVDAVDGGSVAGRHRNEAVTPEVRLTENASTATAGRFSHRHSACTEKPSGRCTDNGIAGLAHSRGKQKDMDSHVSLAAFERLLKVHATMRSNYECLQQNQQVLKSFYVACAESLWQLGLPLCREGGIEEKMRRKGFDIIVGIGNASFANDGDVSSPLFLLSADTPLYTTPISFPPPPVEALLRMTELCERNMDKDSGDLLLETMEVVDGTDAEGLAADSHGLMNSRIYDPDFTPSWKSLSPGLESLFAALQNVPIADIVQLMETVAHFKWVKDEEMLEWKDGFMVQQLRLEISALFTATMKKQGSASIPHVVADVHEVRQSVEHTSKALLNRIPRIDRVEARMVSSSEATERYVHVIDLMLNVLIRVCLWKWPRLSCGDQMSVVLYFTYPWFSRDLSVEAVSWMTYFNLRAVLAREVNMNHYQIYLYTQRIRRLCWPSVQDMGSSFVRRLFFCSETPDTTGDVNKGPGNTRELQAEDAEVEEASVRKLPSLKEIACVLYGSKEKQRAAYECLLIWLQQSKSVNLQHTSPHGRYLSAIGIAIADVERFVTERCGSELAKGEWILLRVSETSVQALKRVTQGTQRPYALTRLFFCRYHGVVPQIWHAINEKRRELLWNAWLCGVARPLVDAVLQNSEKKEGTGEEGALYFMEPLIASLISDVVFHRFIARLVVLSLKELGAVGNTQSLEITCTRIIETVYTGAFILHCSRRNESDNGARIEAISCATTNTITVEEKTMAEQSPSMAAAIRCAFKEAISVIVQRMGAEHASLVHSLLEALFKFRPCNTVGEAFLFSLRKELHNILDDESHEMLNDWLNRRAALLLERQAPLDDRLLRGWQRAAQEADAGLSTTPPTLVECYQGLLRLVETRGHLLVNAEQQKHHNLIGDTSDTGNAVNSSCKAVFTSPELEVILTVLARCILCRAPTLNTMGVKSLSSEFFALTTPLKGVEEDNKDSDGNNKGNNDGSSSSAVSGGGNRKDMEGGNTAAVIASTNIITTTTTLTADRVMLLEKILSAEVALNASSLPWSSLLEAILLQLAPYSMLENLCKACCNNQDADITRNGDLVQKLEDDIYACRHHRFVSALVLFRCYSFAVPHDGGWSDATLTRQPQVEGNDVNHTSLSGNVAVSHVQNGQLREITWLLLKIFVQTEARILKKKNQKQSVAENVAVTEKMEGVMRREQLEYVLACHALVAYMHLAPSFSTRSLSQHEAYEQFLHCAELAAASFGGNHSTGCDMLFLWLAASANTLGVHLTPAQRHAWSAVGSVSLLESGDQASSASLGEGTMRLMRILAPYVQSELFRPTPRLKLLVNAIVAIQTFGRLGIQMETGDLNLDQLLQRASSDRRLMHRHLNLFLVGCSALPSTRPALLNVASFLREARNVLAPAEIDRALVAVTLSANSFAKNHEIQADLQQNGSLLDVTHSTAPTMRATPTQLRHAWSALARRVLERAEEMPTTVFVKSVQCAGAVACVDTLVCRQLLSFLVEFRREELSLLDWTVIFRTARQSFDNRGGVEEYLKEPVTAFLLYMSREDSGACAVEHQRIPSSGERLVEDFSLFVEALPELFTGDAVFWGLVRRALRVQWITHFNAASSSEQQQQSALWLQELTRSYEWAVRTAGYHELSTIPIL
ncbi:hypothetical protein TraAM80_01393 [Trypanosoma rangeli]|uniref:Uncharacterized protein n=1 Tax=Trypanosoma rangeli TaxID=5698 RepID=A0A422NZ06_TRYRA|nr:uncharacterized protein TraAM80_01393 [Trypanosoma rangeli]RNF10690.1 hypothetical protein TraAM80_01393 [Trypanosoma rangeli]|eukprot:RNF10690.1 hypothetical protein TraAM80_01393 [Trypanosoma rangeli]